MSNTTLIHGRQIICRHLTPRTIAFYLFTVNLDGYMLYKPPLTYLQLVSSSLSEIFMHNDMEVSTYKYTINFSSNKSTLHQSNAKLSTI
jgi:hypothetical protein